MSNLHIKRNNILLLCLFLCFVFFVVLFCFIEFTMLQRVVLPILISSLIAGIICLLLRIHCKDKFVPKIYLISILVHFIFILFWQFLKYYILGLSFPTENIFEAFISDVDGIHYHDISTDIANHYSFDNLCEKHYGGFFPNIIATLYLLFGTNPFIVTCFNSIIAGFISILVYLISKEVINDNNLCKIYSLLCVFCTSYIVNTSVMMRDGYITLFIYLSIYLSYLLLKTKNIIYAIGFLFSLILCYMFRPYAVVMLVIGIMLGFVVKNMEFSVVKNKLKINMLALVILLSAPIILLITVYGINYLMSSGGLFIKDLSVETLIEVRETAYASSNSTYSWDFGQLYGIFPLLPFMVGYLCLFFAPFPIEWIYVKRLHFVPDMLILYLMIPSFIKNLKSIFTNKNYFLLVYFFTMFSMFTIYCITVGNSGTIHRLRGPYIPMIYLIAMYRPDKYLSKILCKIQKWGII